MGCIMTPMPNHLSTLKPHHNRVENTTPKQYKPHKTVWKRRAERCGNGTDEKDGADEKGEMVRLSS